MLLLRVAAVLACMAVTAGVCPAATPGHQKMVDLLKQIAAETADSNPILGDRKLRELRVQLQAMPESAGADQVVPLLLDLGEHELRQGNVDASIEALTRADRIINDPATARNFTSTAVLTCAYRLAIAFLRKGETLNCAARHTAESCILPITGGGIHVQKEGSTVAMHHLERVLHLAPENSTMHLRARWLLNIAAMTLGTYPAGVPEKYRIPPGAFESAEECPRFPNTAPELGLNGFNLAGSVVLEDFNNDGQIDILVSSWDPAVPLQYFQQSADGEFENRTRQSNLSEILGGFNMIQADYDNDGLVDVLVLRGAWLGEKGLFPKSLLKNMGNGAFEDVTFESGLGEAKYPSQTAGWADYDLDGDLDLYIGNEAAYGIVPPCQLFVNDKGTFAEVGEKAGVTNQRFAKSVAWGDYDNDRDPDLYVSNLGQPNRLYRNNGDGTFTDVAEPSGVTGPAWSFPAWFWDYNNDGALDLYVAWYDWVQGGLAAVSSSYLALPGNYEPPRLYEGNGKGGFRDVARERGLKQAVLPMGANFGDLDNDGWLDFYLGTGYPDYESLIPNIMYRNMEGQTFADITSAGGFGHLQKGHGIAFADLDNDGDQDVYEQIGGFFRGDGAFNVLYRNPGFGNHWLKVRLRGVQSNRSAIGARIHVVVHENGKPRSIYKHVNSGGSFGASPLMQSIGLGKAEKIERLEVYWPVTGKTQTFTAVPMDTTLQIVEGEKDLAR